MNVFPSEEYFKTLSQAVLVHPHAVLSDTLKPKRIKMFEEAYKVDGGPDTIYNSQTIVYNSIQNIQISHLLAYNDVIIPVLEQEYLDLKTAVDDLKKKLMQLKSIPEAKSFVENITKTIGKENLKSLLHFDLEYIKENIL